MKNIGTRNTKNILSPVRARNDADVVVEYRFFFTTVRRFKYLRCLPFSEYIMLGVLSVRNDPYAEVEHTEKCTYRVVFLFFQYR